MNPYVSLSRRARVVFRLRAKTHGLRWLGTKGVKYVGLERYKPKRLVYTQEEEQ